MGYFLPHPTPEVFPYKLGIFIKRIKLLVLNTQSFSSRDVSVMGFNVIMLLEIRKNVHKFIYRMGPGIQRASIQG